MRTNKEEGRRSEANILIRRVITSKQSEAKLVWNEVLRRSSSLSVVFLSSIKDVSSILTFQNKKEKVWMRINGDCETRNNEKKMYCYSDI